MMMMMMMMMMMIDDDDDDDDGDDDDGTPQRNHYWSFRDIPKFGGKVNSHTHTLWNLKIPGSFRYEDRAG